jgi:hypothetical protein
VAEVRTSPGTTGVRGVPHRYGVQVGDKLYYRDEFYAADHLTGREWLAFSALMLLFVIWTALVVGGLVLLLKFVTRAIVG